MDQFDKAAAFMALQGVMAAADAPDFEKLEEEQQQLIRELSDFQRNELLAWIAGILTLPQFHANTMRIELLQMLVHRNAAGSRVPERGRVYQWLNRRLANGWAWRMEDPVEDVFISNVVCSIGNSRIFEGIWEANDFSLQEALDTLRAFRTASWATATLHSCFALLALSERLAERCGLARFSMGGGNVRCGINLPTQAQLADRARLVRFSGEDLEELGINRSSLTPFIHPDRPANGGMGSSSLEHCPLLEDGTGVLIAIPSAISPAIRRYIVESLIRQSVADKFDGVLCRRQISRLFGEGIKSLGGDIVLSPEIPSLPNNAAAIFQQLVQFDRGKIAHILYFKDPSGELLQTGLGGILELAEGSATELTDHCQKCAEILANSPDVVGGMTIAVHGGMGRGFIFGSNELPDRWYPSGFHLHDFLALGRARRMTLLSLWRLLDQECELAKLGIRIVNMNGELNLLGFWRHSGERLLPKHVPARGAMVQLQTDFVADMRNQLRNIHDEHAIRKGNPEAWVTLRRYHDDPFFKELENDPVYIDASSARRGQLRGVVETATRGWWVCLNEIEEVAWHRDLQYRIWYALLSWMNRIACHVESIFESIPYGPIEIVIEIRNLGEWKSQRLDDLPDLEDGDVWVDLKGKVLGIELPLGFLRNFAQPINVGERKLIEMCLVGIAGIAGQDIGPEGAKESVQEIVRNNEARFFHLLSAQSRRQLVNVEQRIDPRFVRESEINFAAVGLAQRVTGGSATQNISGPKECNKFLHKVVDDCWTRIRKMLDRFNRESVIIRALENVEAIEFDKESWKLTASALLAIHEDRQDVIQAARKREHDRGHAEITSRVLVEMAICACSPDGGMALSESDFDELSGIIGLMIYAANNSDAICYNLTSPEVEVFPNGEFSVDEEYMDLIVRPYIAEYFTRQFTSAAAGYADYFRGAGETDGDGEGKDLPQALVAAFLAEYNVTPEELIRAQFEIARESSRDGLLVAIRSEDQIRDILQSGGLGPNVADTIFKHFSLWPRGDWDKTPVGFTPKDWYPWRFRRRLSVLARPFLRMGEGGASSILFAPALLHDVFELLFSRLLNGRLPAEYFRSQEMRSWIGSVTRLRGDEFEEEVASTLREAGLSAVVGRPMTEFGADQKLGDLDVLAWIPNGDIFYLIECKRLRFARTTAEIGEQLREFKGVENDRLGKHVRRCDWLRKHPEALTRFTSAYDAGPALIPLLVTSTVVPMQFTLNLPLPAEQIIPLGRLVEAIKMGINGFSVGKIS